MADTCFERYITKNGETLRYGYTTGSCATAASKAAAHMLLAGEHIDQVSIDTPGGIHLMLDVEDIAMGGDRVSCAVRKDAGDDPDITNGILVYATVCKRDTDAIDIDGGEGVGRVTQPGLDQPVGAAAINRIPRRTIYEALLEVCRETGYDGGLSVTISIPEGTRLAGRTFNPRLGIEGGLSVLGTSGIVEPMSEDALVATIKTQMSVLVAKGCDRLVITPGNYGMEFAKESGIEPQLQCSNYVGDTLDLAVSMKVREILFVAHIGKFIKVAGGIMNTHSSHADARMELLAAFALKAGAKAETARQILEAVTTEEGILILDRAGILTETMGLVKERILFYLDRRVAGQIRLDVILFSNKYGRLV